MTTIREGRVPVDLSEIDAFSKRVGMRCAIDILLAGAPWKGVTLVDDDRDKLRAALLEHDRFTNSALSNWLKSKKIDLGDSAIGRHRNGGCRCARP